MLQASDVTEFKKRKLPYSEKFWRGFNWRNRKKIKFGADLIWRFQANCAKCAKFSPRQNLPE